MPLNRIVTTSDTRFTSLVTIGRKSKLNFTSLVRYLRVLLLRYIALIREFVALSIFFNYLVISST
jgi:hypothetical protein